MWQSRHGKKEDSGWLSKFRERRRSKSKEGRKEKVAVNLLFLWGEGHKLAISWRGGVVLVLNGLKKKKRGRGKKKREKNRLSCVVNSSVRFRVWTKKTLGGGGMKIRQDQDKAG